MSPIGKIFIVLNLALAVLFLGWSSSQLATEQDYLRQRDDLQSLYDTDIGDKDAEISQLRVQLSTRESALSTTRQEKDAAEADATRLRGELSEQKQTNDALNGDITVIRSTLDEFNNTISDYKDKLDKANDDVSEAVSSRTEMENEREDALAAQREAEADRDGLNKQIASLEIERTDLRKRASELDTQLSVLMEATGTSAGQILAMPPIDGAVLQVNHQIAPGLVSINKGAADGVERGFTFDIYRGAQYKGQVRVENVQPNMCTCVIIKTYASRVISQGDSASTRI